MKMIFAIVAAVFLFASTSWAQLLPAAYSTDQANTNFEVQVTVPIQVLAPSTVQLGVIAPGSVTPLNSELYRMQFQVTGASNWGITLNGTVNATGNMGDCNLTYRWDLMTGLGWTPAPVFPFNTNLNQSGTAFISIYPTSITAQPGIIQGGRSFTCTLTATYLGM